MLKRLLLSVAFLPLFVPFAFCQDLVLQPNELKQEVELTFTNLDNNLNLLEEQINSSKINLQLANLQLETLKLQLETAKQDLINQAEQLQKSEQKSQDLEICLNKSNRISIIKTYCIIGLGGGLITTTAILIWKKNK